MNLGSLITEAQRIAGRVDNDWNTRTRRWLNEAQELWALSVPWPTLVREEDFPSPGTRELILPQRVRHVQWMADKTNSRPMDASNAFDREFPSHFFGGTQGSARFWREMGMQAVTRQPVVVGPLSFRTDTSQVISVCVEGLVQDTTVSGTPDQYSVARETVSIASSGVHTGTTQWVRIETLGKDNFTPSDVVVRDSSSNILAHIPAFAFRSEYRRVEFIDVPTAGTVLTARYLQGPPPLVNTTDVPHTSVDTEFLIWYAASVVHEAQGQAEQAVLKRRHAEEILQKRIYKEKMFGDQDIRGLPEPSYWQNEEQYQWPIN